VELKNPGTGGNGVECDGAGAGTELHSTFLTSTGRGRSSIIFTGRWRVLILTSAQASTEKLIF